LPAAGLAAAQRVGAGDLICLHGEDTTVFCAGLLRPRIYITGTAAHALSPAELDAVVAHEAAHICRRDPLRRLLLRAAADVLFYLPLTTWWSRHQAEQAELAADRAAIGQTGPRAVAAALLAVGAARPSRATAPAAVLFDAAINARIARLSGETVPGLGPSVKPVLVSLLGLVLVLSLAMCLGQAVLRI
jgi:Zn-dependent protease with chaperone function